MVPSKRTRYEVFRRDDHTCRYCGSEVGDVKLVVDHVLPVSLGGTNEPDNLVTACQDCNQGKASTSPTEELVADVSDDALRWSEAIKAAATQMRKEQERYNEEVAAILEDWDEIWGWPKLAPSTVEMWLHRGLNRDDIQRFMRITADRLGTRKIPDRAAIQYLAGCCWRQIDQIEERAREQLAEGTD